MAILIDCGTNEKQGLLELKNKHSDVKSAYTFEANPIVYNSLDKNDGINYFNVAVTDEFGFTEFYAERDISKGDRFVGGGSRIQNPRHGVEPCFRDNKLHPISGGRFTSNVDEFIDDMYFKTVVPKIRLVSFIDFLQTEDKSIILKLDIEGSEYPILQDMQNNNTFRKIKKIYVEFHEWSRTAEYKNNEYWLSYFSSIGLEYGWWG